LSDQAERVNLIVVLAGRETQELGPQVSKPWRALPHVEAEHRHAAAHRLRAHGLVAPAWELLAVCVGVALDRAPLEERAHAGNDLPVLLSPKRRPPFFHQVKADIPRASDARRSAPDITCRSTIRPGTPNKRGSGLAIG